MAAPRTMALADVIRILRQTGYTEEQIDGITAELGDPVDLENESLIRHGLTRDRLTDLMGGSP
jgi:hypothetical protein